MNSKHIGADMVYAYDTAEIGMMNSKSVAKITYSGEELSVINEKAAEYAQLQTSPLSAAKRGYVDNIISVAATRKYVIGAFEMLFTKERRTSKQETRNGLVRCTAYEKN